MSVVLFNSLGGFTTLLAAAALPAEQVKGVSLLNSAGQFGDDVTTTDKTEETALHKFIVRPVEEIFQRVVVGLAFWLTMQPAQIEAQLKSGVCCFLAKFSSTNFLKWILVLALLA